MLPPSLNGIRVTLPAPFRGDDPQISGCPGAPRRGSGWSPLLTHPIVTLAAWSSEWSSGSPPVSPSASPGTWRAAARTAGAARLAEGRLADAKAVSEALAAELKAATEAAALAETARAVAVSELELLRTSEHEASRRAEEEREPPGRSVRRALGPGAGQEQRAVPRAGRREAQRGPHGGAGRPRRSASRRFAQLLDPLSETLARYERGLQEHGGRAQGAPTKPQREGRGSCTSGTSSCKGDQRNLVTALRSPQTRGRWGEIQLRRVVEMAGMLEHCDFDEQVSTTTDGRPAASRHGRAHAGRGRGGRRRQGARSTPSCKLIDADDDEQRALCQAKHARAAAHPRGPAGQEGVLEAVRASPQLVVAFIPGDQLLAAAFESDPDAAGARHGQRRPAHHADHADRAPAHGGSGLAAGDAGRERPRGPDSSGPSSTTGCATDDAATCSRCSAASPRASRPTTRRSARSRPACSCRPASSRASASWDGVGGDRRALTDRGGAAPSPGVRARSRRGR